MIRTVQTGSAHDGSARAEDLANTALKTATLYFDSVTRGHKAAYMRVVNGLAGDYSPKANRARDAAMAAWRVSTAPAAKLYAKTFEELIATGTVSAETVAAWSALPRSE